MEALALMLIHLLTPGGLSWTRNGVPKSDTAHERLKREKRNARPEDLCKGIAAEFEEFLRYCRRLKFKEKPDYAYWRNEFCELAERSGFPTSDAFVWPPPEPAVRPSMLSTQLYLIQTGLCSNHYTPSLDCLKPCLRMQLTGSCTTSLTFN